VFLSFISDMCTLLVKIFVALMVCRNMSDAGSDDLDEERVQDLGVRICSYQYSKGKVHKNI